MSINKSYVLSVSLMAGCYRHISVPGAMTLEELSDGILDIFEFDNDHQHAFFMDNRAWSRAESYYANDPNERKLNREERRENEKALKAFLKDMGFLADMEEMYEKEERSTDEVKIGELGLEKGRKFLYLFDFGEEWRFNCRVLRIEEGEGDEISVLKSVGSPPEQYPSWDEEEDEDYE